MSAINWGLVGDGGAFESLMHAILYAEDPGTILFGRPGKDAGQDARSADGTVVYQAKYRQSLAMDGVVTLALEELKKINGYRQPTHDNHRHWQNARRWVLVANLAINPNDDAKWESKVVPAFQKEGLDAEYWDLETLGGKLAQHPEVCDVFFGGENRVLVGLKEAHDLLEAECVGSMSFEVDMMGRDRELETLKSFAAAGDKRVLPVVGPAGIGKSRLLYEGLVALSQDGWRVLWALPGSMARSSQWFRLLNGTQKTCIAIDDPDDAGLLRTVIEQLATVERQNWRVVVSVRPEREEALRRYRTHSLVHRPVVLPGLGEDLSGQLVEACTGGHVDRQWLHSVYEFTAGVPGWLCLIAELNRRGALSELPSTVDGVAIAYLDSCMSAIDATDREHARQFTRWLSLWGALKVEGEGERQAEFMFLDGEGIPAQTAEGFLRDLTRVGLIRNWGINKRLFAVEPLIVRQHVLADWLLREDAGEYDVSPAGEALVSRLVKGEVPAVDAVLRTLSRLTRGRLTEAGAALFMKPIFGAMEGIARDGTLTDQYAIADLVEKAGASDPENALDVLSMIRGNPKESVEIELGFWGNQTLTHAALVAKIPWTLFQVAERVLDPTAARRYLNEFRQLVELEDDGGLKAGPGKGPRQLLKRLLCESSSSEKYAQPAYGLAIEQLATPSGWPFVGLLAECVLNPIRETMEWVHTWSVCMTKRAFVPQSLEWNLAADLREKAFATLRASSELALRPPLWRVLAESHGAFHRAVLHGSVNGPTTNAYRAVLEEDLTACKGILTHPPVDLSVEEATAARGMWKWYLEYGRAEDPVVLAQECEQVYSRLSKWRPQDFFRFGTDDELAPETERVAESFQNATKPEEIAEFFNEAERYLAAVRKGRQDMADRSRAVTLAKACAGLFLPNADTPNAVTAFAKTILQQPEPGDSVTWDFVVRLCQHHIRDARETGIDQLQSALQRLMAMSQAEHQLLYGLYSNAHPGSIGLLTDAELDCVLGHESGFPSRRWFALLGVFVGVAGQRVLEQLKVRLDGMREEPDEASECLGRFIVSVHIAGLRYQWEPSLLPVAWIVSAISEYRLDGVLLGSYDLEWMRGQADFRLDMVEFKDLIHSRIDMEKELGASTDFEIVPHDFPVGKWAAFDPGNPAHVAAFREFCILGLEPCFTAIYWMPKYIRQLDSSGKQVASAVEWYLGEHPELDGDGLSRLGYLASSYPDDTDAWAAIASLICVKARDLRRDDREQVYFGLGRKETGAIVSAPGEVADYYVKRRDNAARLLAEEPCTSPLRPYREWALMCAEQTLQRETERAEEDKNG